MGFLCQDSAQAGTFCCFLNTSLRASAELGLNSVDEMLCTVYDGIMGLYYVLGWIYFEIIYIFGNSMDLDE